MEKFDVIIIGAGASGIAAAISAKKRGSSVIVCERLASMGKKILASGGGRCNLLNEELDETKYNPGSRELVKSILGQYGRDEIKKFFAGLGLFLSSENNRVFPATNQSASVLRVLELELRRLSISVEFNFEACDIRGAGVGFTVISRAGKKLQCSRLILACGGMSYPALGSNGGCYKLAENYGHKIIECVPVCVPLLVKDPFCHLLQGQKVSVTARSVVDGETRSESKGDVLFTKYGLSGTAVLDVSRELSVAINREHRQDAYIFLDLAPFLEENILKQYLSARLRSGVTADDLLCGVLPNKFILAFKDLLESRDPGRIAAGLKEKRFKVLGTRGWNEAEFTAGGIDTKEVKNASLESSLRKGLYFCGEALDVDGKRGGYNLAWAWSSGFVAGLTKGG
ncbi:MAG: aminoacetone oxidase family FAD-binding enzyme [Candidatus Omnitrophica bacterium]|jgi:hypothetical protein|nr:aminoacetone oxidase family FAD-binding enzyme [Candidatus Omnitrophota bacterium]MDD5080093.1 aminoacetone oxidase family FAD-binding enzyme [Candidatus Omnitrophota bacterium]